MNNFFRGCILAMTIMTFLHGKAQVTLTKGETIAYLNKKIKEVAGFKHPKLQPASFAAEYLQEIKLSDNKVEIIFTYIGDSRPRSYKFNPLLITRISSSEEKNATTGLVYFDFNSMTVLQDEINIKGPIQNNYAVFPYLIGDGSNFEKIKKAFLHLQALLKAEDDPFQN